MVKTRIVCISDTHNAAPGEGYTLPSGDVLIHAGDLTNQGTPAEIAKAVRWIEASNFAVKLIVAGNHDLSLDPACGVHPDKSSSSKYEVARLWRETMQNLRGVTYLEHSMITVEIPKTGALLRVFGSPYSRARDDVHWAFQYSEQQAEALWRNLRGADIVVTHTPSAGFLDASRYWTTGGCPALAKAIAECQPLLHVFGHCHEGRGAAVLHWGLDQDTATRKAVFLTPWDDPGRGNKKLSLLKLPREAGSKTTAIVNASIVVRDAETGRKAFNKPVVVDIDL